MINPGTAMMLMQAAPALVSAFTQNKTTAAEKQQRKLLEQQAQLIRDSADPNSDIYKQQYGIETGNVARDYAKSIEEIVRTQRRNNNMGRTGLIDNERADETLSRLTNEGMVQANQQGRVNARNSILGMANSAGSLADSYGGLIDTQSQRGQNRSSILSSLTQSGVDAIASRNAASQSQGRTIADIYRDMNAGAGGQNPANMAYNQSAQMAIPRLNAGGWVA